MKTACWKTGRFQICRSKKAKNGQIETFRVDHFSLSLHFLFAYLLISKSLEQSFAYLLIYQKIINSFAKVSFDLCWSYILVFIYIESNIECSRPIVFFCAGGGGMIQVHIFLKKEGGHYSHFIFFTFVFLKCDMLKYVENISLTRPKGQTSH